MGKEKPINWKLKIKGFGPFEEQLNWSMCADSSKVAIYAGNGQGKTTISRLFRFIEKPQAIDLNALVTKGSKEGTFTFAVGEDSSKLSAVEVSSTSEIDDRSECLFHVFNSDYVRENLQEKSYSPSGEIEGYIIGRDNINLSSERQRFEEVKRKGTSIRETLDAIIKEARGELASLGAEKVHEYRNFSLDSLAKQPVEEDCYDEKVEQLKAIDALGNEPQAPEKLYFEYPYLNLDDLESLLEQPYSRANFAEAFLEKIRKDTEFIKAGMRIQDGERCPFCGRRYDDESRLLIDAYDSYLSDEEAAVISRLEAMKARLSKLVDDYGCFESRALRASAQFNEQKTGFSALAKAEFPAVMSTESLVCIVEAVKDEIDSKMEDITLPVPIDSLNQLEDFLEACQTYSDVANGLIDELLKKTKGFTKARTNLRKDICTELGKRIRREHCGAFEELAGLRSSYKSLEMELRNKEAYGNRSKREAVAQSMRYLLRNVFGERYIFDASDFSIRFKGEVLGESADFVLSDGEKAVIAFCFYVASTWEVISSEDDKDKLFFVIDDPVSSMDFNYVYSIMQVIKDLQDTFGLTCLRILLLTHNVAFFNMLMGTKTLKEAWMLDGGTIVKVKNELLAPYAAHLRDVYNVANGGMPTHTTGNSIRQILETLMHFEDPSLRKLSDYLESNYGGNLKEIEYLYTICNDQSHGSRTYDDAQPIDVLTVRRVCRAVIEHVADRYPGQLKTAGIELGEIVFE